jgi:hypothetical protein
MKYSWRRIYPSPYRRPEQTTYDFKLGFTLPAARQRVSMDLIF